MFLDLVVGASVFQLFLNYFLHIQAENRSAHKQLKGEASIYRMLQGGPGIPKYHVFFQHGHWNMLTLQVYEVMKLIVGVYLWLILFFC